MSRSRRHTKIFASTLCKSEKDYKRFANRRLRCRVAVTLRESCLTGEEPEVFPIADEVSDAWNGPKDGKGWWGEATEKDMRK